MSDHLSSSVSAGVIVEICGAFPILILLRCFRATISGLLYFHIGDFCWMTVFQSAIDSVLANDQKRMQYKTEKHSYIVNIRLKLTRAQCHFQKLSARIRDRVGHCQEMRAFQPCLRCDPLHRLRKSLAELVDVSTP